MNEQIRVVHVTTVHHPHDPRIFYKQCISLKNAGYDVTFIAQRDPDGNIHHIDGIKHHPLTKRTNRLKRMIFGSIEAYRKAKKERAHIYVFHDPELMFIGALLKRKDNIVIYDIHEDYVTSMMQKEYVPKWMRRIMAKLYKLVEKICTRKMELSLAEKYYKDIYPRGTCILNYPLLNETLTENVRKEAHLVPKVLYTGNVTYERGALIHAQLPKIVPNLFVQFVGKCASSLANDMVQKAGDKKDYIDIYGIDQFIVKEEIDAIYAKEQWLAGIALFPPTEHYMKKELTKFFEYMNAGLPIICSNFPVWKTFVETYECGIAVDPYDEADIRRAFETLLNDRELAIQMGENGRRAVQQKLNWHAEEKKLLTWYDQLLKGMG
ncbi:MAG TPA: glycosyltransferase [Pseudogracilibacillus sp.]|nr:glycosyltransferase [Pseudogracilibacillus sp.]